MLKSGLKMGSLYYFLSPAGQNIKNITKSEKKRLLFFPIIEFILYGVSHSKTD